MRLLRYNGKHSSKHTNRIERSVIKNDFHIHMATERYQLQGFAIDGFAEPTDKYADFETAIDAMLADNNFVYPGQNRRQKSLNF